MGQIFFFVAKNNYLILIELHTGYNPIQVSRPDKAMPQGVCCILW